MAELSIQSVQDFVNGNSYMCKHAAEFQKLKAGQVPKWPVSYIPDDLLSEDLRSKLTSYFPPEFPIILNIQSLADVAAAVEAEEKRLLDLCEYKDKKALVSSRGWVVIAQGDSFVVRNAFSMVWISK